MKKPRRQFEDFPLASLDTLYVKCDGRPSKDFMKRSAQILNIEEKEPDPGKVQQHGLLIKHTMISRLRAAACKNRELHFSDHLVEFLIFRLKIPLE